MFLGVLHENINTPSKHKSVDFISWLILLLFLNIKLHRYMLITSVCITQMKIFAKLRDILFPNK